MWGSTSSVQFLVLGFCMGMCNGFAVPVARYFGAGDYGRMRQCITHALVLTAGAAGNTYGLLRHSLPADFKDSVNYR